MSKTVIIAEAGVNNNGRLDLSYKLCDAAKKAGADVVKFQTFRTEALITRSVGMASYQARNLGRRGSQFQMLKGLELPFGHFKKIKDHCARIGIRFMSTPTDIECVDLLVALGLKTMKIASAEVCNVHFLRQIGQRKLDVILSTGMATLAEVRQAYAVLKKAGARSVSLLQCTTNYPCAFEDVNLRAMLTLKEEFGVPVGLSDHTPGIEVSVAAVALGAGIIEKHFTLDKTMKGPDHRASLEPGEFRALVSAVRHVEQALGDGVKRPRKSEQEIRKVLRRSIVAARPISRGAFISSGDLAIKRASGGLSCACWDSLVGRRARKDFCVDEPIVF